MGYAPCKMCLWQRWPHMIAVAVGGAYLAAAWRPLIALGGLAAAITAGLGVFHAGVERGWWRGPDTCTSGDIGGLSPEALMEQILTAPIVRCDEIAWQLAGISMAGWNALLSATLAVLWFSALFRRSVSSSK
jgi:disulfide bond formation protein DsbB